MKATYHKYILNFKNPSGTSRGVLRTKETWFILLTDEDGSIGIGETGLFRGLSADDVDGYENQLQWVCEHIHLGLDALLSKLTQFPSIQFGLEQAFLSLESDTPFQLFPSNFSKGFDTIQINGLIWMGDKDFMHQQIKEKIEEGYTCIKMKIGAIDFDAEMDLLRSIRKEFSPQDMELRVDANGAFSAEEALDRLDRLSKLKLHSIEQPIKPGQTKAMAELCKKTPLPIALDEELIGVFNDLDKKRLLQEIQPQYIILKPSLIGGFQGTDTWINLAKENDIGWWITSALESNIGLNAIAQYTYGLDNPMPQGLGTGSLFTNNVRSPLVVENGTLFYDAARKWTYKNLFT